MDKLYLTFLLCLSCLIESVAMETVLFKTLDLEQGLTNNTIFDIAKDNYGNIWVATDEGLDIISGDRVRKFYKSDKYIPIPGNELNCLVNDSNRSTMWIGTQRSGITGYNYVTGESRQFQRSGNKGSLGSNDITSLCLDENDNLWISSYSNGLHMLNPDSGEITAFRKNNIEGLQSNKIWDIAYDATDNTIYAGHVDGGFSVIYPKRRKATTYTTHDGLPGNNVRKVLPDEEYVWLCTDNGISRFDKIDKTIRNFPLPDGNDACRDAIIVGDKIIFAFENKGLYTIDRRGDKFSRLEPKYTSKPWENPEMLAISQLSTLFEDSFGNILIGTLNHGLFAISANTSYFLVDNSIFRSLSSDRHIDAANIIGMASLRGGDLWLATANMGLFNAQSGNVGPASNLYLLSVAGDSDGTLWFCDRDGTLVHLDPESGTRHSFHLGVDADDNMSLEIYGDSIWIGTNSGIILFDKKTGTKKATYGIDEKNEFIRKIKRDDDGNLYVGSFGEGLVTFDSSMNITNKNKVISGFPSNTVNDILIDGESIWVATGEGLVRFKRGQMDKFTVVAHNSRSVRSIIKDRRNNVWFSAGDCIGVVLPDDSVMYFTRELPMKNFNNASAAIDSTGRIYFGSKDGLLTFMPEYVLGKESHISPLISNVIIESGSETSDDVVISSIGKNEIRLNHNDNNITIVITNNDIFRQGDSFEYRMRGLDDKWYAVGSDNHVSFRELPYGSYVFEVRNIRMDSHDQFGTASLKIEILPPLWLRWWAKLIYIILACILVAIIIRHYIRRINSRAEENLRQNKERQEQENREERIRFFTNVTHELRTPLTLINGPLEDLLKGDSLNNDDRWKVDVIHKNAQRLLSLVNQLLDFRKTETNNKRLCVSHGNIVAAVKEIAMKYVELNRNPNVTISVNSSVDDIPAYFDKEMLTMILDNLISNAMKYTETGMITVSVNPEHREDGRWIKISVRDTGHGISQEALPYIFERYYQEHSEHQASGTGIGLALVKALVTLHDGEISVESAKGVGSCFSVSLKRDWDYPEAIHIESAAEEENNQDSGADVAINNAAQTGMISTNTENIYDNIEVLVVEDNPDIREYISQSLTGMFNVKTAANGRDGLEIASRDVPDIVVTDIMMPVMDGIEMTRHLKDNVATSHIPVVMLTAKDSTADRQSGYDAGVDSYITKPFNASLLIARINNIISRRHMLTEYLKSRTASDSTTAATESAADESRRLNESLGKLDREFIAKLDHAILDCDNPDKVNLEYLTDVMCMSRPTLYRKMKAVTGMSGNEYIRHVRMKMAKELLLSGEYNMSEIAERLGFSSPSYFRETFKTVYGMTPTEYLKSLRQQ